MPSVTATTNRDVRTEALVLRRVNYGEADRILTVITSQGLAGILAKGVRREKSKLAGGIELFCLSEITYHQGKPGSNLATLTSAKMQKFYQNLMTDLDKMTFASEVLRRIARAAEAADSPDFFALTKATLEALNGDTPELLVETYFWLNFAAIKGEPVNFSIDTAGEKLKPDQAYAWSSNELAFTPHEKGTYAADDIKYLRLMLSSSLALAARVKYPRERLPALLYIAKSVNML